MAYDYNEDVINKLHRWIVLSDYARNGAREHFTQHLIDDLEESYEDLLEAATGERRLHEAAEQLRAERLSSKSKHKERIDERKKLYKKYG